MTTAISLRLPFETGTRLHNLALSLGTTVTDTVAMLLDLAAHTGIGTLALPGIDIKTENDAVSVKFDNLATKPLSRAQARAFAHRIRTVSSGDAAQTDLDCPDWIKVTRTGRAIVIEMLGANGSALRKTFARGLACSVAERLVEAASVTGIAVAANPAPTPRPSSEAPADSDLLAGDDIVLADNDNVDALLADLDLGPDEATAA